MPIMFSMISSYVLLFLLVINKYVYTRCYFQDTCGILTNFLFADFRLELCDNNIQGGKLTSGYKSGQDVTKPISELFPFF